MEGPLMLRRPGVVYPAYHLAHLVRMCLTVVEVIIGLRVLFRAVGSQDTGLVAFIYGITGPLVQPWREMFGDTLADGHIIEVGALVAMVIYAAAAMVLIAMMRGAAMPRRRIF
jgi:uncharacterized protein YggT (Ycf19 family)